MKLDVIGSGSKGNSYILHDEESAIIIDAGINLTLIKRCIDFKINKIKAVICSHIHSDHSKFIQKYLDLHIKVFMPSSVKKNYENNEYAIVVLPKEKICVDKFQIIPFELPHDGTENYGYYFYENSMGRLLYMTDMEFSPYSFKNLRVQHLLIEANYIEDLVNREAENYAHQIRGHCSLNTCKGIVETNKTPDLRTVTLIHLSNKACDPNRVLKEIKEVSGGRVEVNVAVPGLRVELKRLPF